MVDGLAFSQRRDDDSDKRGGQEEVDEAQEYSNRFAPDHARDSF
jgi:hypothetical protein